MCRLEKCPKSNKLGGLNKGVEVGSYKNSIGADLSEINKRGKVCSCEIFFKKNKKNSMLIRAFRIVFDFYEM